ncbi:unnamed protein product [Gadus morhua 'NCC']
MSEHEKASTAYRLSWRFTLTHVGRAVHTGLFAEVALIGHRDEKGRIRPQSSKGSVPRRNNQPLRPLGFDGIHPDTSHWATLRDPRTGARRECNATGSADTTPALLANNAGTKVPRHAGRERPTDT